MRREAIFSRSGFYGFLLESNVLLHREATKAVIAAARSLFSTEKKDQPIKLLDLACGGWPVSVADLMAAYPEHRFDYTGVDINPDQVVLAAGQFPFPDNVIAKQIIEGNAWELDRLGLDRSYDLIFSGMNIHHGTPGEVAFLARQIRQHIRPGGLFFSHDVYRPDAAPYLARPEIIEGVASCMVDPHRIGAENCEDQEIDPQAVAADPSWRSDYLQRMHYTLLQRGAELQGAESTVAHMRNRDYPISTREMRRIMEETGFEVSVKRFSDSPEPLGPYIACCVMRSG